MLGLSTTAIGGRSLEECLEIYQELCTPLDLDFFELAVGCQIDADLRFDMPVVLHDKCLFQNGKRVRFSLLDPNTWGPYIRFCQNNNVLRFTLHPPKLKEASSQKVGFYRAVLEQALRVRVDLEIMWDDRYYLSKNHFTTQLPLLFDISHANIWFNNNQIMVAHLFNTLLQQNCIRSVHLSYNKGKVDSHDLIPDDYWAIEPGLLKVYKAHGLITYESLPERFANYERLDKKRAKIKREGQRRSLSN